MSKDQVIVHVGLHKTGTTWLQESVFRRIDEHSVVYSEDRGLIRGNFVLPSHGVFSQTTVRDSLSDLLSHAADAGLPLLLSDESLAGFPFGHRFSREVALSRIHETFPNAQILVTIREQRALLRSYYGHYIRGGGTASLADFLAQPEADKANVWDPIVDLDFFDYDALRLMLESLFERDRVMIVPMEWMLAKPAEFLSQLERRLTVTLPPSLAPASGKVVNPAWSPLAFEVARYANHLQSGKPRWRRRWFKPNRLADRIDRLLPGGMARRGKAKQSELVASAVGNRYANSNSDLAKAIGLDLTEFGYATR